MSDFNRNRSPHPEDIHLHRHPSAVVDNYLSFVILPEHLLQCALYHF